VAAAACDGTLQSDLPGKLDSGLKYALNTSPSSFMYRDGQISFDIHLN
jgi:hypothetical protein